MDDTDEEDVDVEGIALPERKDDEQAQEEISQEEPPETEEAVEAVKPLINFIAEAAGQDADEGEEEQFPALASLPTETMEEERDRLKGVVVKLRKRGFMSKLAGLFGAGGVRLDYVEAMADDNHRKTAVLYAQLEYRDRYEAQLHESRDLVRQIGEMKAQKDAVLTLLDTRNELLKRIFRTNRLLSIKNAYVALLSPEGKERIEELLDKVEGQQDQLENSIRAMPEFSTQILPDGLVEVDPPELGNEADAE